MKIQSHVYRHQYLKKRVINQVGCSLLSILLGVLFGLFVGLGGLYTPLAKAEVKVQSSQVSLEYRAALNLKHSDLDLSRVSLASRHTLRLNRQWSAQLDSLSQVALSKAGLGSTDNFSSLNQPLLDSTDARIELTRAFLMWRKRGTSVVIGKQVTPWGVLDGVQVTDRFDPVRRRDFILTDMRPERIARWGIRWRSKLDGWHVDTSLAFDGTSTQQANIGDTFFLSSTRFTGGLSVADLGLEGQAPTADLAQALRVQTPEREHTVNQSTAGVKFGHSLGEGDMSVMLYRGPDTDPVIQLRQAMVASLPINVSFDYLRRTVLGATYDVTLGALVWRMELAYIPDQPFNVLGEQPLMQARAKRMLIGGGVDWRAPANWFVNAQLVVDHIREEELNLVRPATDTLLTLRAHRSFFNERLLFKTELIGSLNQGDGTLRPALVYDYNDNLKFQTGIDWLFGDPNGQFGQFKNASRWWVSVKYTF